MDSLPVKISLDIFSRIPADTVLVCKQVCKRWRDLISRDKANFAAMHLLRQNHHQHGVGSSKVSTLGLIFLILSARPAIPSYPLYYGELDEKNSTDHNELCIQDTLRSIKKYFTTYLIGSCNGLVCLIESSKPGSKRLINICNPVTRESLYIQHGLNENIVYENSLYIGFGYTSHTNEYKIVRILYSYGIGHIEVYTLGSRSGWRNKGEITASLESLSSARGVFFNGALHWLSKDGEDIRAFNLSDEMFHVLPGGPFSDWSYKFTDILESSGEWLCVSGRRMHCVNPSHSIDIWTYKNKMSDKSTAGTNNMDESWSWCKEFSINLENYLASQCRPFAVTKSGLVLLGCLDIRNGTDELFCYDPKTATMKRHGIWNFFDVIPHTNSFVSPEVLGEITCKKRKNRSEVSSGIAEGLASLVPNH